MNNKIIIKDTKSQRENDFIRDSLEDLSLYILELERIVNTSPGIISDDDQYKLKLIEQHIENINNIIKVITPEYKTHNIKLS